MRIEFDEECSSCKGTGLYVGCAERDGYAVVCYRCNGTGKFHFAHDYNEFTGKKEREGVTNVLQANPGIMVGQKEGLNFGGIPYEEWLKTGTFPAKSEMRQFVCPAWWYQSVDYAKKPNWNQCDLGAFSACHCFGNKEQCWERWDREYTKE